MNLAVRIATLIVSLTVADAASTQELYQVADANPGPPSGSTRAFTSCEEGVGLTELYSSTYLFLDDGVHGKELWRTDGTAAGTALVVDLDPINGSQPNELVRFGDELVFSAEGAAGGVEVWRTDGTAAGTVSLCDCAPGSDDFDARYFTVVAPRPPAFASSSPSSRGILFFSGETVEHGRELWVSDGTTAGTNLVSDIDTGPSGSFPEQLRATAGGLFFVADDSVNNEQLWFSDGTAAGTSIVEVLAPTTGPTPEPRLGPVVDGVLFFAITTSGLGAELWRSDGTAAGTSIIKDIRPGSRSSDPANMVALDGLVLFTANDGSNGDELWRSDGTAAGTYLVKDIRPGPGGSSIGGDVGTLDGVLFFKASDGIDFGELWRSDGTAAGTFKLLDLFPGSGSSQPGRFVEHRGLLYFRAKAAGTGLELFVTDGTAAGTRLVSDLRDPGDSLPDCLTEASGRLLFIANDGLTGKELWSTVPPGTTQGRGKVHVDVVGGLAGPRAGGKAKLQFTAAYDTVLGASGQLEKLDYKLDGVRFRGSTVDRVIIGGVGVELAGTGEFDGVAGWRFQIATNATTAGTRVEMRLWNALAGETAELPSYILGGLLNGKITLDLEP